MSVKTTKKEKRIKSPYWRSAIQETPVWTQKRKRDSVEDFDPRPMHLHNTAPTNLSTFLTSVRDLEPRLGVSVLMDETLTSQYKVPEEDIPQQVEVLIRTQTLSDDETRRAESNTREQNQCKEW